MSDAQHNPSPGEPLQTKHGDLPSQNTNIESVIFSHYLSDTWGFSKDQIDQNIRDGTITVGKDGVITVNISRTSRSVHQVVILPKKSDEGCSTETVSHNNKVTETGLPRFWELFPIILPRSIRERVYEPAYEELKEDYMRVRNRYRTPWAKRWVKFAFTVRTVYMVGQCFTAMSGSWGRRSIIAFVAWLLGGLAVDTFRQWYAHVFGRLP